MEGRRWVLIEPIEQLYNVKQATICPLLRLVPHVSNWDAAISASASRSVLSLHYKIVRFRGH